MLRISGIHRSLELFDPSENLSVFLSPDSYSELVSAGELASDLKNKIQNDLKRRKIITNECLHWQDRGWRKSLDYYIASKNTTFNDADQNKNKTPKKNSFNQSLKKLECPDKIKNKTNHGVLESLMMRRTKRVFKNETLCSEIFDAGLLNVSEHLRYDNMDGFNLYYIIYDVKNIDAGVYFLDTKHWTLKKVILGNFSTVMASNLQGLRAPNMAFFTCIFVADFDRLLNRMPYEKGLRTTYVEVGRLAQKVLIGYGQYGFGCLPTPALSDRNVAKLLKLNEADFAPLYSLTFGYPVK